MDAERRNIPLYAPWNAMGVRAVFLVGFMASGKSSWGENLPGAWSGISWTWMPESKPASGKPFLKFFGSAGNLNFG